MTIISHQHKKSLTFTHIEKNFIPKLPFPNSINSTQSYLPSSNSKPRTITRRIRHPPRNQLRHTSTTLESQTSQRPPPNLPLKIQTQCTPSLSTTSTSLSINTTNPAQKLKVNLTSQHHLIPVTTRKSSGNPSCHRDRGARMAKFLR